MSMSLAKNIVSKNGRLNIVNTANKHEIILRELGFTLISIKWRYVLATLLVVNFFAYFFFAFLWVFVAEFSGDFKFATNSTIQHGKCVENMSTFTGYLLLSIETLTTIGFGSKFPTENCSHFLWMLFTLQALIAVLINGAFVSTFYVKLARPAKRFTESIFSKHAVISYEDNHLRLVFRIYDQSGKIWCGSTVNLYFIDKRFLSPEGDERAILQRLKLEPIGLLMFPVDVEHIIDKSSPLWGISRNSFTENWFELIAVAEGTSTSTGQMSQNRMSYSSSNIKWGQKFVPCYNIEEIEVDLNDFKRTVPIEDMPEL